jgi:hypothetical protein
MGAAASAALPAVIDNETAKRVCGEDWDEASFEAMASEGTVTKEQFEEALKRHNAAVDPATIDEVGASDALGTAAVTEGGHQMSRVFEVEPVTIEDLPHPWYPPASGLFGVFALSREEANRLNQHGMKWESRISTQQQSLGCFPTRERAALAYDKETRAMEARLDAQALKSKLVKLDISKPDDVRGKPMNYDSMEAGEQAVKRSEAFRPRWILDRGCPILPKSMYHGVSASGTKWKAEIVYGGHRHHIGRFDRKEEAAVAYDKRAKEQAPERPLNYRDMFEPKPTAEIVARLWKVLLGEATEKKQLLQVLLLLLLSSSSSSLLLLLLLLSAFFLSTASRPP